jgi:hypothetical protein
MVALIKINQLGNTRKVQKFNIRIEKHKEEKKTVF